MSLWKLEKRQVEFLNFIDSHKYTLGIGKSRAGKSLLTCYWMVKRAFQYPGIQQVVFRKTYNSVIQGIVLQTIPEVLQHFFPIVSDSVILNKSNATLIFPNGSRIMFRGLDDIQSATKILSQQFATVYFDECQTISYEYFGLLLTRIPQPKNVPWTIKVICNANWAPKTHWTKYFFYDKVHPVSKKILDNSEEIGYMTFQTTDNTSIDAEKYMNDINNMADERSKAMCMGDFWYDEFGDSALWIPEDIKYTEVLPLENYDNIVLVYDPAVSNNISSDAHGICITGKVDDKYHIIKSYEKKCDINMIIIEIIKLYHEYKCNTLIFENNQGGDYIPNLINSYDHTVNCESIRAVKGKLQRAQGITGLYKNNLVYHCEVFKDLENQMFTYNGKGVSPNSLDAHVYSLLHLKDSRIITINDVW